jgi:hypothetical protein
MNRVLSINRRPCENGRNERINIMCKHRQALFAALALAAGSLAAALASAGAEESSAPSRAKPDARLRRYIYVLNPDGSHVAREGWPGGPKEDGIVVLDIDNGCSYVRRIPLPCLAGAYGGHGGRGIAGHTGAKRLFYTFMLINERTLRQKEQPPAGGADAQKRFAPTSLPGASHPVIGCVDVETDRVLWEVYPNEWAEAKAKAQGANPKGPFGAGNPAVTLDGKKLYVPPEWTGGYVTLALDAETGKLLAVVPTGGTGCGNAIMSPDGKFCYASGHWSKIDTATDKLVEYSTVMDAGTGEPVRRRKSSHFIIDASGQRMYLTHDGAKGTGGCGVAAVVCSTETGAVLHEVAMPETGGFEFFRGKIVSHEGSFTPCGKRFWTQGMEWHGGAPILGNPLVVDNPVEWRQGVPILVDHPAPGSIKWVGEWDLTTDPPTLRKYIATRSPGHCHAHVLVTREGDLVLTGNGYALDTATGKIKHAWKDKDGKWFQGTKFMQVNFRDGQVDWVGQRHGTGWLYKVPALSERGAGGGPVAGAAAGK